MATRRVFVIWAHALFHAALRRILTQPEIEWVGATSDHTAAHDQIARLQPDTILIEEAEGDEVLDEMLAILEASSADVRVIRLSLADNELSMYQREQRTVAEAEDLLRLIRRD